jgi:signal transduction histidine kinase
VRKPRIFQTTIFRLAAFYVIAFATTLGALSVIGYQGTYLILHLNLDRRVQRAMSTLKTSYEAGGVARLVEDINAREHRRHNSPLFYLVLDAKGKKLAGHLTAIPTHVGWSKMDYVEDEENGDLGHVRILLTKLSGGERLAVGGDLEAIEDKEHAIFGSALSAFVAVVLLGSFGGLGLSFTLFKRVESIRQTAEAIIEGDLSQRIPVRGGDDDLDRLSRTLNNMLDRISELMESLRQVSTDIAHDLKTPLARLRRRLEAAQGHVQSAEEVGANLESAIVHVDEILATFSALLRIAQIESGTRRSGFRDIDLSCVFQTVIEAFAPAAEDVHKRLVSDVSPNIRIWGDFELLTQMIANVVENAVRHTSLGTLICVSLRKDENSIVGVVSDNGPGVPDDECERLFQRFYRLERSRSTPGNGLGLSLVKAVAELHGIGLEVRSVKPGLEISMRFPL